LTKGEILETVSAENVDTARRLVAAFNDGDVERFLADTHADAEIDSLRAQLEGTPYRGHDGIRQMFADFDEDWEYLRVEIDDFRDTESNVVGTGHLLSRGRASRVDLDVPIAFVWRFKEGKAVYAKVFSEEADALRAAGLD
jgi:ketosteroid isomerase-like protein